MENNAWEFLSPTNFTFRAYGVEEKRELILKAVEDALEQFKYCDAVQIDITAPAKEPIEATGPGKKKSNTHSSNTIVKGFAGGD